MRKVFLYMLLQLLLFQYAGAEIHFWRDQINIDADTSWARSGFINIGQKKGLRMVTDNIDRYFNVSFQRSLNDPAAAKSPCIGTRAISFYFPSRGYKLNMACREAFLMSDEKSKTEIRPLSDPTKKILSYKDAESNGDGIRRLSARKATAMENEYRWLMSIAPGAVDIVDSDTVVNYNELIPLLVSSAQELTAKVEQQNEQISRLQSLLAEKKANMNRGKIISCAPNPTSDVVEVTFRLNDSVKDYAIYLVDFSGIISDRMTISRGDDVISLSLSGKRAGTYHLVLIAEGKTADTYTIIKK